MRAEPVDTENHVIRAREIYDAMQPWTSVPTSNFIADEGEERVRTA
jgi:hypothetical protein